MDRKTRLINMLQEHPDDVFLRYALAMEQISESQNSEAIATLESILDNQPDYLPTYYQLAKLYESVDRNDKAIEIYEKGMVLAESAKEMKTYGELRSALEELTF